MKNRLILMALLFSEILAAKTYFVAKTGNDKSKGEFKSPFLHIQQAADVAQAGDTIFVMEGIYRERVSPPRGGVEGFPIVYMGEPNKNVVIKGSDIWKPEWRQLSPKVYYSIPDETMFNDNCYKDNKNPFKIASSATPYHREGKAEMYFGYKGDSTMVYTIGQIFVNGQMFIQRPFLSEMNANEKSWFYDKVSGNLYIHFEEDNPAKQLVEISTRRRIFAPHKRQLGYIVVQGFIMEHCGNQYPANFWEAKHPEWQQAGAVGIRSGHHWVIKQNVIRFANGIGIDFGNEGDRESDLETGDNGPAIGSQYNTIDSNYITDNGAGGTAAYYPDYVTFINNVVERNVNLRFRGKKRWESAGVKMHGPNFTIISNNLIQNNYEIWGLWLDQGAGKNTQVHANLIVGSEIGFDLEIGSAFPDKLILDNNIFINNKIAIGSRESGGLTALNNLILGSSGEAISNSIEKTRGGSWSGDFHYYFNNILIGCQSAANVCPPDYYRSADRRFDCNLYQAAENDKVFKIRNNSKDSVTFKSWKERWNTYNKGKYCENNSALISGISYEFNSTDFTLKLSVPEQYLHSKTTYFPILKTDFMGEKIPFSSALPGPFQKLHKGKNEIMLWKGLKPLSEHEMPLKTTLTSDK
jgi:hypothetical protein